MQRQQCHYLTLGIAASASDNEVRSAYRRRALVTHPDKGGTPESFRAVVQAFETLVDTQKRAAYDKARAERLEVKGRKKPRPSQPGQPGPGDPDQPQPHEQSRTGAGDAATENSNHERLFAKAGRRAKSMCMAEV